MFVCVAKARKLVSRRGARVAYARQHAMSERIGRAVRISLVRGITRFKENVPPGAIEQAIRTGEFKDVVESLPWGKLRGDLGPTFDALHGAARESAAASANALPLPVKRSLRYDVHNPRIADYIENQTGNLITTMKEGTLEAVRSSTKRAMTHGLAPSDVAKEIRGSIGLNARQSAALANFRSGLQSGPRPRSDAQVEAMSNAYEDRLLDARAIMIARTEVRFATNEGQLDVWRAADQDGLLPDKATKVWVVDGRPCPQICAPMNNVAVGLDEPWVLPDGREVMNPTESHPNCFCICTLNL